VVVERRPGHVEAALARDESRFPGEVPPVRSGARAAAVRSRREPETRAMSTPAGPPGAPGVAIPPGSLARVREAFREGRAAYGDLGVPEAAFLATVSRQTGWNLKRRELDATAQAAADYLARAALEDLYLAGACEGGSEGAWAVLHAQFAGRLEGFAVRRGRSSAEAEGLVQDLFGDLAAPPPGGVARTLLGTFDATGSLFGWLSIVLLRRIAAQARRRRTESLEVQPEGTLEEARAPGASDDARPALESLVEREQARRIAAAVEEAFESLTPQQRFALVLKHRDGRTQREIGALLGVGEARVSRVVSGAVERLSADVRAALGDADAPDAGSEAWAALLAALARHLASRGPQTPPTQGGSEGPA
jgi:RNA polymerase sigma factor (sigma-70 family)